MLDYTPNARYIVSMEPHKPVIGILGAIASGKSAVAAEFAKLGCAVIDADRIARDLLEDDDIKLRIKNAFGPDCMTPDGAVDRDVLAEKVFRSRQTVDTINAIIHPPVLRRSEQLIAEQKKKTDIKAIVLDMPLLLEAGCEKACDVLVYIDCDEKIRAKRTEKAAESKKNLKKRENFQISLDIKAEIAHYTICNNSDFPALAEQVVTIFTNIIKESLQF